MIKVHVLFSRRVGERLYIYPQDGRFLSSVWHELYSHNE